MQEWGGSIPKARPSLRNVKSWDRKSGVLLRDANSRAAGRTSDGY